MINEIIKLGLIICYVLLFFYLIKKEKQTVLYAIIVFVNLGIFVSLILIEYGMFIHEQQIFGFENGAFYIFYLFCLVSLILFHYLSVKKIYLVTHYLSREKRIFIPISILFGFVLLYCIIENPNYTRFDIFDGPFKMLFVRIEYIFTFAFLYTLFRTRKLNAKLFIYVLFCLLMFMRGSQFGAFMIATIWLFIAYYLGNGKLNIKWFSIFILLALIPFAIKISLNDILFIYQRIILEGHVFWGTINLLTQNGPNLDFSGFINNFNDLSSGFQQGNIEYGFGKLMFDITPHFAEMSLDAGVRFASGYPAILIYHFGYVVGLLFHLLFTLLFFLVIQFLIYCFKYKDFFYSYVIYMIYMIVNDFMIQGEYAHFRGKFLIKIFIVLSVVLIYKIFPKKNDASIKLDLS